MECDGGYPASPGVTNDCAASAVLINAVSVFRPWSCSPRASASVPSGQCPTQRSSGFSALNKSGEAATPADGQPVAFDGRSVAGQFVRAIFNLTHTLHQPTNQPRLPGFEIAYG